ncbi:hypothetical protein HC251_22740 [Iamia sp. SCSIO 61187]|uniref:hypothetical protein n=1 Tax=Iamia sp. SCSIO 61187 TaxID=2722752 RepID=UPI00210733A0|nr:hypothetical protein [Iamia sp. SCSIO 61187]QYG94968.1 hypothetical protein HC251_22740 [Iamia sp. SCSIO 61187]
MSAQDLPPDDPHRRPDRVDDATVEAVGKVSEAMEWVERARGHLYELHQLLGHADLLFGEAADMLDDAGHAAQADGLREAVVGRNVIEGRWTFQLVEDFDDGYWSDARDQERRIRDDLMAGRRHVFESEMKEDRRTKGRRHHESRP